MVLISLPRKQCNLHQEHCYSPANPHRCGTSPQTAPPRCCNFKLVLWQGGWSESRGSTGFLPHVLVMPLNSGGILRIFKDFMESSVDLFLGVTLVKAYIFSSKCHWCMRAIQLSHYFLGLIRVQERERLGSKVLISMFTSRVRVLLVFPFLGSGNVQMGHGSPH